MLKNKAKITTKKFFTIFYHSLKLSYYISPPFPVKLMEKAIYTHSLHFISFPSLLNHLHFDFPPYHSSETASLQSNQWSLNCQIWQSFLSPHPFQLFCCMWYCSPPSFPWYFLFSGHLGYYSFLVILSTYLLCLFCWLLIHITPLIICLYQGSVLGPLLLLYIIFLFLIPSTPIVSIITSMQTILRSSA